MLLKKYPFQCLLWNVHSTGLEAGRYANLTHTKWLQTKPDRMGQAVDTIIATSDCPWI